MQICKSDVVWCQEITELKETSDKEFHTALQEQWILWERSFDLYNLRLFVKRHSHNKMKYWSEIKFVVPIIFLTVTPVNIEWLLGWNYWLSA